MKRTRCTPILCMVALVVAAPIQAQDPVGVDTSTVISERPPFPLVLGGAVLGGVAISGATAIVGFMASGGSTDCYSGGCQAILLGAAAWPIGVAFGISRLARGRGYHVDNGKMIAFSALGVGMFGGSTVLGSSRRSMGSFGGACVCASLILFVAVTAWPWLGSSMSEGGVLAISYGALAAIGYATAAGRQALMNSVASRSSEGAKMMGRLLVCAAATIIGTSFFLRWVDAMSVLLFLAIMLVMLGGTLMMLEPTYSARTRRIRMIAVVIVVAATVVLVRSA